MPVEIHGNTNLCLGESTTLTVTGSWFEYIWTNGSASQSITTDFPQTYCVIVTDFEGCTGSACVDVEVFDIAIAGEKVICTGHTSKLYIVGSPNREDYVWSTGSTSDTLVISEHGIYCVTVTSTTGCTDTACFQVSGTPIINVLIPDLTLCPGETLTMTCPHEFSLCVLDGIPFDQPVEIGPGLHTLEITDIYGCIYVSDFHLEEIPVTQVFIDTTLCQGDTFYCAGLIIRDDIRDSTVYGGQNAAGCDSIIVISVTFEEFIITDTVSGDFAKGKGSIQILNIVGGTLPYQYLWSTGSTDPSLKNLYNGQYSVTITDAIGCQEVRVYDAGHGGFDGTPDDPVDIYDIPLQGEIIVTSRFVTGKQWRIDVFDILGKYISGTEFTGPETAVLPRSTPGVLIYVISDESGILSTFRSVQFAN